MLTILQNSYFFSLLELGQAYRALRLRSGQLHPRPKLNGRHRRDGSDGRADGGLALLVSSAAFEEAAEESVESQGADEGGEEDDED